MQNNHSIVSPRDWDAAREQLLAKEKALFRARDALAAERRRMPWMAVEKAYEFVGPKGKARLIDLFEGRRQLIVYRAFFEPGVFGWPDHACRGCSLGADQVSHLAHLNARDTTLAYVSRAPQADIARLKARMGWEMPWYTITDSFDADFGVDEWHGHNVFFRDGDRVFRTYFINSRGDEAMGTIWSYLDATPLGRQETWEDSPEGVPKLRHTNGGTGTTTTRPKPRPIRNGSRCRTPERRRSETPRQAQGHDSGLSREPGREPRRGRGFGGPRRRRLADPCGRPDLRDDGADHRRSRRRRGAALLCDARGLAAQRNGPDVSHDERLPFGAVAETDRQPATRRRPDLIEAGELGHSGRPPSSFASVSEAIHESVGALRSPGLLRRHSPSKTGVLPNALSLLANDNSTRRNSL